MLPEGTDDHDALALPLTTVVTDQDTETEAVDDDDTLPLRDAVRVTDSDAV